MTSPENEMTGISPPVSVHAPPAERRHMRIVVLLVLSAGAMYLLGRIVWPFATALVLAVVLAFLAHPAYRRFRSHVGGANLAAFLATAILFFLVLLPVAGLSVVLFNSIHGSVQDVTSRVGDLVAPGGVVYRWISQVGSWIGVDRARVVEVATGQLRQLEEFLAGHTVGVLSGLGGWAIQAGVALFTLFYLLRDGETLVRSMRRFVPLADDLADAIISRSGEIIYATVYGHVVVALILGLLGGVLFWLLGIPGAALWGTVMAVLALLPAVGTPLVWVPAGIILLTQGKVWQAVVLLVVEGVAAAWLDNPFRAYLVSDRAEMHPLVVFFSVLGGILLFGLVGLFLGPILVVAALSILDVTRLALEPEPPGGEATQSS